MIRLRLYKIHVKQHVNFWAANSAAIADCWHRDKFHCSSLSLLAVGMTGSCFAMLE